jgi:hypothetical protein
MSVESSIFKLKKAPEKLDKNAEYRKELLTILQSIVKEINGALGEKLLADDGCVSRKGYDFSEEELAEQKEYTEKKEKKFIRKKFNLKDDTPITKELHAKWEREQQERLSELMEMAVMVILHKVLKDDYVVCRANKYDDYHGIDNIIVNKQTGDVLCTFDDVRDDTNAHGIYEWQKELHVEDSRGKSKMVYAFTFEENKLIRKEITNIPKFYLRFDKKQLEDMLKAIDYKNINSANNSELAIYNFIIESLASQINDLKKQGANNQALIKNLDTFESSLPNLRSHGQTK